MSKRNGFVDFQKILFSLVIVLHHSAPLIGGNMVGIFSCGLVAVEFFFIVSGFLMAKKAEKFDGNDLYGHNVRYIVKRYTNIFPYLILAVLTAIFIYKWGSYRIETFIDAILFSSVDIFGLQMIGFQGFYATGVAWYLSILFFCGFLIYPMMCKNLSKFAKYTAPLFALILLGFIARVDSTLANPGLWYGHVHKGLLRGFADISLGATSFELSKTITNIPKTRLNSILFKLAEAGAIIAGVGYGLFRMEPGMYDFFFPALFCISVAISFSDKSLGTVICKHKIFNFLGTFSLSIFLNHYYIYANFEKFFPPMRVRYILIVYLVVVLVISTINYILGQLLINKKTRWATIAALTVVFFIAWFFLSRSNGTSTKINILPFLVK